jgi:hypothetical protein
MLPLFSVYIPRGWCRVQTHKWVWDPTPTRNNLLRRMQLVIPIVRVIYRCLIAHYNATAEFRTRKNVSFLLSVLLLCAYVLISLHDMT